MDKVKPQNGRKTRVAVLYGGRSSEHEVSIRSATNVIQNLDRSRYDVVPIGIDKKGSWFLGKDLPSIDQSTVLELEQASDKMLFTPSLIGHNSLTKSTPTLARKDSFFDVVFPVIHGIMCEDGTVQGLLELAEVPYVGCGVLASAVGMDKDVSKRLIKEAGINVPPYLMIKRGEWNLAAKSFCEKVNAELQYPVFVKPSNTGSSVGIRKVKTPAELVAAIDEAFLFDTKILVEQGIDAIEIEVSVLEALEYGRAPIVSTPGEIRPQNGHEFYSYASKYLDDDGAAIIIPAPIAESLQKEIQIVAQQIFAVLDCEGMARVDLFVERGTNKIYFNEVNTLPGFTQISMYPKLLMASGMTYTNLLTHLVELALERHKRRSVLQREYIFE